MDVSSSGHSANVQDEGGAGSKSSGSKKLSYQNAVGATSQQSRATHDEHKRRMREKAEQEKSNLWQHPFVDVFKHFKIIPGSDWKQNKKFGDVTEYFAKEIGRRALCIEGTISANNYVQVPHPQGTTKQLGLTGRYVYFQVKLPRQGLPFSYHIDLGMAERSHGVRISMSNLFKNFNTSNGFVAQVPLELKNNCWTVVVLDIYELLKQSKILPPTYLIDGSYQIRSINVCANSHLRGIFTSDNLYDFVTMPADMRYKFAFDLSKWMEYFDWQQLPQDWSVRQGANGEYLGDENMNLQNLISQQRVQKPLSREDQRKKMKQEIDDLLNESLRKQDESGEQENAEDLRKQKYDEIQAQLNLQFKSGPADHPVSGYIVQGDDDMSDPTQRYKMKSGGGSDYRCGQFSGYDLQRSHKLNKDPIMELKHIIGYQADKCLNLKWSRVEGENVILFTSGGTIIAMDTESNQQKRFFFGHSAPICCFDLSPQGNLIASAQEGKNSIIRIWDYATARCITMVTMPVVSLKCLSFSYDGNYLASVGKDSHNKELIIIWDISRIQRGEKPEIVAKQSAEFNILCIKFSPIDSTRLASCGKENIRFWRIRNTGNIRGSAVVLNHHARNTVFTSLDFEYGFRSTDKDENESLKRVFVGSKHGIIFQINYQTETLEATYKTNDGAIYSIAVNDAFCVIGSEDTYLRVWPLDFQEFFMEAQHEGTVSAVDISPDGLKVGCGTLYGSIGILDKSNQNYKTLLRSHTDEVLAMDFHRLKQNIITVSRDKTIRLWDVESFDEVYEFSSPVDQPLCVSSHPQLPIFACGFESGKMRIFDIDRTEVLDEFSQLNKPLKALRYDNSGKLLVACCVDGTVSIHNAARQHLPIKMMHLELPPEFVHVAFTDKVFGEGDSLQKFGLMGEYGNNVVIYEAESFLIQHHIQVNHIVRSFKFSNSNRDLLVVTKDCKVRFYSLMKYDGIFLREVANCHRGSLNCLDVSSNSGYMLTCGDDSMLKIWDYEAQKSVPYYFQSFIGHTYPVTAVNFNPKNNGQIISVGERDGIFIWDFNGDIDSDYKQAQLAGQDMQSLTTVEERAPSLLEKIRTTHKAKKTFRNQMSEDSFIIPQFKPFEQVAIDFNHTSFYESPNLVKQQRADRKLTYNHYASCSKKVEIEVETQTFISLGSGDSRSTILEQRLINGYDGFGGVHDNLIWNVTGGFTYFTLNNKVIIENTKTREQQVFADSTSQFSCLANSPEGRYLAAGEGSQNRNGNSLVLLYDLEKKKLINKLTFHEKGIQSMAFSYDSKYLITVGVQGENTLAVWEISSGLVIRSAIIRNHATNQVKVDPFVESGHIQFVTVGNNASLTFWRLDTQEQQLSFYDVQETENLKDVNFLSLDFTQYLPAPANTYYVMIGADDGSLVAYDQQKSSFIDLGTRGTIVDGAIGQLSIKNGAIVLGSSSGMLARYPVVGALVQPEDPDMVEIQRVDSAVVAISMDELNNEGLVGTESGAIHYVNFPEKIAILLVQSNNRNQEPITYCKMDPNNTNIFVTNCGNKSDEFKLNTIQNCDQVMNFQSNFEDDGYVVFVISNQQSSSKRLKRLVGFSNGVIKRVSFDSLQVEHCFKVPLNPGEKLTCGTYSQNGINFAVGSNQGNLFIASLKTARNRVEATYCRLENVGRNNTLDERPVTKYNNDLMNDDESIAFERMNSQEDLNEFTGITSISFPFVDPIGTMLIAFDDGTIKVWQSAVKNEVYMKILELQQAAKKKVPNQPVIYDISQIGYQQFDLVDSFDIFQNPHGLEEITEADRTQLKALYSGKKYKNCRALFAPGSSLTDQYFCYVDALQYIFIRNYVRSEIIKRISLSLFPTCLTLIDFGRVKLEEESAIKDIPTSKGNFLVAIGTKEGKAVVYRIGQASFNKLLSTKSGVSFGGISAIDVSPNGDHLIAASESGEIIQYDLLKKMNEE